MTRPRESRLKQAELVAVNELKALEARQKEAPFRLRGLAEKRWVDRVEFRPLLGDGCLIVHPDHFTILINCQPPDAQRLSEAWENDATGTGQGIGSRHRFTVAHEVVHTFFFKLGEGVVQETVSMRDSRNRRRLERFCQRWAGKLLIPEPLLQRVAADVALGEPESVGALASTFLVSAEALIRRFEEVPLWSDPFAGVALIATDGSRATVVAAAIDPSIRGLFPALRKGHAADGPVDATEVIANRESCIYGGPERTVEEERAVRRQDGEEISQRFIFSASPMGRSRTRFIVTMRRIGQLEFSFQR